jgi:methionyl-tRNA formyltransferase
MSSVDFIFSALHSSIIKEDLIKLAKNGVVNFHAAPTPPIRGFAGYTAAYLKKMTYWGATSFFIIDEGIDNGPIILRKTFKFDWRIGTALSLKNRTFPVLLEVMRETIQNLKQGNYEIKKQPEEFIYFSKKEFEEKKIIYDSDSVEDIELKCRAYWYPPYEGATIIKDGERFTIAPITLMSDSANFNI